MMKFPHEEGKSGMSLKKYEAFVRTVELGSLTKAAEANLKPQLRPRWHWLQETEGASYAWGCDFNGGYQGSNHKSVEGSAVAVRSIPLIP